jgi:hypothetical protein
LFSQLPIITRFYITLSFFTTAACALEVSAVDTQLQLDFPLTKSSPLHVPAYPRYHLPLPCHQQQLHSQHMLSANNQLQLCAHPVQVITPFNVYFNAHLIFKKGEVWRLLTNFFFFGNLGEHTSSQHTSCRMQNRRTVAVAAQQAQ